LKIRPTLLALAAVTLWASSGVPAADPPPSPLSVRLPDVAPTWRAAGDALRAGDCKQALQSMAAEADPGRDGSVAPTVPLLLEGLYAYTCDQPERARDVLFTAGGRGTPFEDWRLVMLAESAVTADGDWPVARAAYEKVVEDYPDSPARWTAFRKGTERALDVADGAFVLELAERARREIPRIDPLTGEAQLPTALEREQAGAVERAAWRAAGELRRPQARRAAGQRLLALDPELAEELGVSKALEREQPDESDLWPVELLRLRAMNLLRLDRDGEALAVLEAMPPSDRDFHWYELAARALVATERGAEATALLAPVKPANPDQRARLAWQRARALREAATVRSGRSNPPQAEREEMLRRARQEMLVAGRLAQGEPSERALRAVFADLAETGRFDEAMAVLRDLRRLDPRDETGARHLWERGWSAYRGGNASGAVGYWAELGSLYPDTSHGRSARYWTARALEKLGQRERGREIYAEVASSDSADFYQRQALARLGSRASAVERSKPAPRSWPIDPVLDRARFLTDVGLDDLALVEVRALAPRADERAAAALEGLVLNRLGEPRASIGRILRAFPELGTAHQDTAPLEARRLYYPLTYADDIRRSAERSRLPLSLVLGMIRQESGFDRTALSHAGARGLMQLMPATAREVAGRLDLRFVPSQLEEPDYNTRLGSTYFRQVLDMFDGDVELALAGYNGGPYRIKRLWKEAHVGGRPPERDEFLEGLPVTESRIYVKRILLLSDTYRRLYDLES
jgi:soluble lytic murein transglycosylase-like protein